MKVFPDKLAAGLSQGVAPIYLVAGPESLLVEEASDSIRSAVKQHGIDERVVIEADGRFDWDRLTQATETGSLFATRRLVELRLPTGKPGKEGGQALRDWAATQHDDVLLIKSQAWEIASEKTAWFKAIDAQGVFVPCWNIKAHQLPQWIERRLSAKGLRLDQACAQFLAERLEGNVLAAAQEIERLALLFPSGHHLRLEELKASVADNARFDAYRFTELVMRGQTGQALRSIRVLRNADTPPPAIIWALSRELQTLAAFMGLRRKQPAEAAFRALRVWPARQAPLEAAAKRLSSHAIGQALADLSRLDRMSKSNAAHRFWVGLERVCVALTSDDPEGTSSQLEIGDVA